MIAAALGFLASEANLLGFRSDSGDLRAALQKQADQIAALEAVEPATPAAATEVDLSPIETDLAQIGETLDSVEARLTTLENRPSPAPATDENAEAYGAELEKMQTALQQQRSEIESLLANAQSVEQATADAAREAAVQSAISQITAAISSGSAYSDALNDLETAGVTDLPEPLTAPADDGVVTLSNLQARFPAVARVALTTARDAGLDGEGGAGVGGFLRRQLGARSVQPKEGSNPDAVLSRAEADLRNGRLSEALGEIDTLPDDVASAMADWLADARARAGAESAINDLSQSLTAN